MEITKLKNGLTKREYKKIKRQAKKLAITLKTDPENAEIYMKLVEIYKILDEYKLN